MIVVVLALAILVGVSLGLLGGGGSILTVPLLTYVGGMEAKAAIASSLVVVGATSAAAVVAHARAGRVRWRTGLLFGGAGMAGAVGGGRLGAHVSGHALMVAFAILMAITAVAMLRPRRAAGPGVDRELPVVPVLVMGATVGVVTGLLGAGGGFVIVPALVLLGGLAMEAAIGTSLLVITMNTVAGLATNLGHVVIDWPLTLGVTAIAIVGSFVGARFAGRIPATTLRRGFGVFIILMAALVLSKELLG
ncbi:MAG: sulfite exporter TauE/SafE family protein [Kofleriaceae bacterium]